MTDEHSEEVKWRKQQIRMHALEMAVNSVVGLGEKNIDIVSRAMRFEDYIFRSMSTREGRGT